MLNVLLGQKFQFLSSSRFHTYNMHTLPICIDKAYRIFLSSYLFPLQPLFFFSGKQTIFKKLIYPMYNTKTMTAKLI